MAVKKAKKSPSKKATTAKRAAPKTKKPAGLKLIEAAPAFTADDLQKSIGWYRDVVGFAVEEKWERDGKLMGASLRAGSATMMLAQDDWKLGRDRRKGAGVRLYFSTAQDVDALAAAIKARGGKLDHEPVDQPWGSRDFALTDPDGFKITIGAELKRR
jgi:uncharacterized glyoxalase superfamily protein PhnB